MSPSTRSRPRRALEKYAPDLAEARADGEGSGRPRRARRGAAAMMGRRAVVGVGAVAALAVLGTTAVIGVSPGRSADAGLAAAASSSVAAVRAGTDGSPSAPSAAQSSREGRGISRSEASRAPVKGAITQLPHQGALSGMPAPRTGPTATRTSEQSASPSDEGESSASSRTSPARPVRSPSASPSEEPSSGSRTSSARSSAASGAGVGDTSGLSGNTVAVMKAVKARYPQVTFITAGSEDHATGHAVDVMVTGSLGDEIAAYVRSNASSLGVHYIIWSQRIWNIQRDAEGWRPMADRGSVTANHYDHVHVSVS